MNTVSRLPSLTLSTRSGRPGHRLVHIDPVQIGGHPYKAPQKDAIVAGVQEKYIRSFYGRDRITQPFITRRWNRIKEALDDYASIAFYSSSTTLLGDNVISLPVIDRMLAWTAAREGEFIFVRETPDPILLHLCGLNRPVRVADQVLRGALHIQDHVASIDPRDGSVTSFNELKMLFDPLERSLYPDADTSAFEHAILDRLGFPSPATYHPQLLLTEKETAWARSVDWPGPVRDANPLILINPGVGKWKGMAVKGWSVSRYGIPLRQWPIDHYTYLISLLMKDFPHAAFLLVRGENTDLTRCILRDLPAAAPVHVVEDVLSPQVNLRNGRIPPRLLGAFMNHWVDLVITPDTGIGHLARAADTPTLVLMGPQFPNRWGPAGAWVLSTQPECAPKNPEFYSHQPTCWAKGCASDYFSCMETILPEEVLDVAHYVLDGVVPEGATVISD